MKTLIKILALLTLLTTTSCGVREIERQYPFGYGPGEEVQHPDYDPKNDDEYYDQ